MRADRLISLVMLLQARGRMTAHELAEELECSERTIYRDVDALSAAGVPIYGDAGPSGGYALLDNYRTELTGLTERELRALFTLTIPAPLADLGLADDLRGALLKVAASARTRGPREEERVRQRFYIDPRPWAGPVDPLPQLRPLQQAALEDRRARLNYRLAAGVPVLYLVDVLGLVARDGGWYVVYRRGQHTYVLPVRDVLDVEVTSERFDRPPAFDLEATWRAWCERRDEGRGHYEVEMRVAPHLAHAVRRLFGCAALEEGCPEVRGWRVVTLHFDSLEMARERLLGFGGAIEVLRPEPLRRSITDYAEQVLHVYSGGILLRPGELNGGVGIGQEPV